MKEGGTGIFIKGVVMGLVLGAVAGVISAPKSGKETRADIAAGTKKYSDKTVEYYRQLEAKLRRAEKKNEEEDQTIEEQLRQIQAAVTKLKKSAK